AALGGDEGEAAVLVQRGAYLQIAKLDRAGLQAARHQAERVDADDRVRRTHDGMALGVADVEPRGPERERALLELDRRGAEGDGPARADPRGDRARDAFREPLEAERPGAQAQIEQTGREAEHERDAELDVEGAPQDTPQQRAVTAP